MSPANTEQYTNITFLILTCSCSFACFTSFLKTLCQACHRHHGKIWLNWVFPCTCMYGLWQERTKFTLEFFHLFSIVFGVLCSVLKQRKPFRTFLVVPGYTNCKQQKTQGCVARLSSSCSSLLMEWHMIRCMPTLVHQQKMCGLPLVKMAIVLSESLWSQTFSVSVN